MNNAAKKLDGSRNRCYWAWVRMRRQFQEDVIIHENVVGFGLAALTEDLSHLYELTRCLLCATMFGFASRRKRQFVVCIHRRLRIVILTVPSGTYSVLSGLEEFISLVFGRSCEFSQTEYAIADALEIAAELAWARGRKECKEHRFKPDDEFGDDDPEAHEAALIPNETVDFTNSTHDKLSFRKQLLFFPGAPSMIMCSTLFVHWNITLPRMGFKKQGM